jgi:hypothetical protein
MGEGYACHTEVGGLLVAGGAGGRSLMTYSAGSLTHSKNSIQIGDGF